MKGVPTENFGLALRESIFSLFLPQLLDRIAVAVWWLRSDTRCAVTPFAAFSMLAAATAPSVSVNAASSEAAAADSPT